MTALFSSLSTKSAVKNPLFFAIILHNFSSKILLMNDYDNELFRQRNHCFKRP